MKKLFPIFKKSPLIWHLKDLFTTANELRCEIEKGKWVPCRPIGCFGMRHRFRAAWLVFSGQADAVKWPNGQ